MNKIISKKNIATFCDVLAYGFLALLIVSLVMKFYTSATLYLSLMLIFDLKSNVLKLQLRLKNNNKLK